MRWLTHRELADDIMDAANDEIIGMLVQEVKDQQDEKMDEAKEKSRRKP